VEKIKKTKISQKVEKAASLVVNGVGVAGLSAVIFGVVGLVQGFLGLSGVG
jgi:hypothetical protein